MTVRFTLATDGDTDTIWSLCSFLSTLPEAMPLRIFHLTVGKQCNFERSDASAQTAWGRALVRLLDNVMKWAGMTLRIASLNSGGTL